MYQKKGWMVQDPKCTIFFYKTKNEAYTAVPVRGVPVRGPILAGLVRV